MRIKAEDAQLGFNARGAMHVAMSMLRLHILVEPGQSKSGVELSADSILERVAVDPGLVLVR